MTVKIQDPELAVKDSRGTHAPCRHQSTSDIFLTLLLCFSWIVWRLLRWHFIAQPLQHKDLILHDHDTVINPSLVCGKTSPIHSCLLQLTCSNQDLRMGCSLSLAVLKLSYLVQADLELTLLSTGMDRCAADSHHRFPLLLCTDVPNLPFSDSLDITKKKKLDLNLWSEWSQAHWAQTRHRPWCSELVGHDSHLLHCQRS